MRVRDHANGEMLRSSYRNQFRFHAYARSIRVRADSRALLLPLPRSTSPHAPSPSSSCVRTTLSNGVRRGGFTADGNASQPLLVATDASHTATLVLRADSYSPCQGGGRALHRHRAAIPPRLPCRCFSLRSRVDGGWHLHRHTLRLGAPSRLDSRYPSAAERPCRRRDGLTVRALLLVEALFGARARASFCIMAVTAPQRMLVWIARVRRRVRRRMVSLDDRRARGTSCDHPRSSSLPASSSTTSQLRDGERLRLSPRSCRRASSCSAHGNGQAAVRTRTTAAYARDTVDDPNGCVFALIKLGENVASSSCWLPEIVSRWSYYQIECSPRFFAILGCRLRRLRLAADACPTTYNDARATSDVGAAKAAHQARRRDAAMRAARSRCFWQC